jgi:hypothetical protein
MKESGHTEAVVYVAEVKDGTSSKMYPDIVNSIKGVVSAEHGLAITSICLLQQRSVEKTTSGKIARAWCRKAYLAGTLKIVHRWDGDPTALEAPEPAPGAQTLADYRDGEEKTTGTGTGAAGTDEKEPLRPVEVSMVKMSAEEAKAMPIADLVKRLEKVLVEISSQSPNPISAPVDANASLTSLGVDSFTLVQVKGAVIHTYIHMYIHTYIHTYIQTPSHSYK